MEDAESAILAWLVGLSGGGGGSPPLPFKRGWRGGSGINWLSFLPRSDWISQGVLVCEGGREGRGLLGFANLWWGGGGGSLIGIRSFREVWGFPGAFWDRIMSRR